MSYCRKNANSDVYIYEAAEGFVCLWCRLHGGEKFTCDTPEEMVSHVGKHRARGDKVPSWVEPDLLQGGVDVG